MIVSMCLVSIVNSNAIYVSLSGNDTTGTGSITAPFYSLSREFDERGENKYTPLEVSVISGEYFIEDQFIVLGNTTIRGNGNVTFHCLAFHEAQRSHILFAIHSGYFDLSNVKVSCCWLLVSCLVVVISYLLAAAGGTTLLNTYC